MMFGAWGNTDHDDSVRIIHRALDAGINFVDTADVYSRGESEEIVGKALAGGRRDNVVLATKFHGSMGDDPNEAGQLAALDRPRGRGLAAAARTDWIDLYQVHRWDPWTDHDETLGALSDLVAPGQGPRYIGSSTYPAAQIVEAQWVRRSAASSATSASSRPTRSSRAASRATCCPAACDYGMGVIAWSPLAGGWLSGKWRKGAGDLDLAPLGASPSATTSSCPRTRPSSTRPTRSGGSPTRRASRSSTSRWRS